MTILDPNQPCCSAEQLLDILRIHFLDVLVLDCSPEPCNELIGSVRLSQELSPNWTIELSEKKMNSVDDGFSSFDLKWHKFIITVDDYGLPDGLASKNRDQFVRHGHPCQYLKGGLKSFLAMYPILCKTASSPSKSDVNERLLGGLAGLPGQLPIQTLVSYQKHLVDCVWFDKKVPVGDLPLLVYGDHLYLSSCLAVKKENLDAADIKHVIRLGWGFPPVENADDINFYQYRIHDTVKEPIQAILDDVCDLIESIRKDGEKVLVHCHAGVSRSSTVVLAYLIKHCNMFLFDAWNTVFKVI